MKVTISETCYVEVDENNNHIPFFHQEGGSVITQGRYKGRTTEDKWVSSGKYFSNMPAAIRYGIEYGIEYGLFNKDENITLKQYVERIESTKMEVMRIMGELLP